MDVVVDGDGDGCEWRREDFANHEDDAKFAESVSEGENDGVITPGKKAEE